MARVNVIVRAWLVWKVVTTSKHEVDQDESHCHQAWDPPLAPGPSYLNRFKTELVPRLVHRMSRIFLLDISKFR